MDKRTVGGYFCITRLRFGAGGGAVGRMEGTKLFPAGSSSGRVGRLGSSPQGAGAVTRIAPGMVGTSRESPLERVWRIFAPIKHARRFR